VVYSDEVMLRTRVFLLFKRYKGGGEDMNDGNWCG